MAYDQKLADAESRVVVLEAERERLRAALTNLLDVFTVSAVGGHATPTFNPETLLRRIHEGHMILARDLTGAALRDPLSEEDRAIIAFAKGSQPSPTDVRPLLAIIAKLDAALLAAGEE